MTSKKKTISFCIPEDLEGIINQICKDLSMSRSTWITIVIIEYLKKMGYRRG